MDEKRHFGRHMPEEGGTGAKPARGTHGPRVVTAAREVIAPYQAVGCRLGYSTRCAPYASEAVDVSSSPSRLNAVGGGTPTLPEKQETT